MILTSNQELTKKILRWLSIIPVGFTAFVLSDWAVRLLFWFMRLPIIIFEKVFGFGSGPIGNLLDSITNYLIGVSSIETIIIIVTSIVTAYAIVYILSIVAPSDNKKTAIVITTIFLFFLVIGLVAKIINGIDGAYLLWSIFLAVGVISALHFIKKETEQKSSKREKFVSNNILVIFISTSLFAVIMMTFSLY